MRFLIAADIVYQLKSTTLAGRSGCVQIEQRAQSKELRKVQENNCSTHKSAAKESTNIYTTECIYQKTKHQNTQPAGCHQNVLKSHQTGRQGPHCITALLNLVRTHPVKFTFPELWATVKRRSMRHSSHQANSATSGMKRELDNKSMLILLMLSLS